MPYQTVFVDPERFLEHNGVTVFHTYKDDDIDQGTHRYLFTADPESHDCAFDARTLDVPSTKRLEDHPPFLSKDNPAFAAASAAEKAKWEAQWAAWHNGGEEQVIRAILIEAIDRGLITAPADTEEADGETSFDVYQRVVLKSYDDGDHTVESVADIPGCGDALLKFLLDELSEGKDCDSFACAIERIDTAAQQLADVRSAMLREVLRPKGEH